MINAYRREEIKSAIAEYTDEMKALQELRIEIAIRERNAHHILLQILYADDPKKLSPIFNDSTRPNQ